MMIRNYIVLCVFGLAYSAYVKKRAHDFMTEAELHHYFGVADPSHVTSYELVHVRKAKGSSSVKRNGEPTHNYEIISKERSYSLHFTRNDRLLAPQAKIVVSNGNLTKDVPLPEQNCHLLHRGIDITASISHCGEQLQGYILDNGKPFEVHSLNRRLNDVISKHEPMLSTYVEDEKFNYIGVHLFKPINSLPDFSFDEDAPVIKKQEDDSNTNTEGIETEKRMYQPYSFFHKRRVGSSAFDDLHLELALFVDEAAYKTFSEFYKNDDTLTRDMILAYVNGMQAIYYQSSLGRAVNLAVVRLEFFMKNPSDFDPAGGERGGLLENFCSWNAAKNNQDDSSPDHWDMGLYVSALDFYAKDAGGKPSYITMGLAGVGGVCTKDWSCVIGEFGTVAKSGKPYPSTGFTAIYVMAHEIGHNLGMFHDSSQNSCPQDGFIMSPSRGIRGEATWSSCSAEVMSKFSETCLDDSPFPMKPENDHQAKYIMEPGSDAYWSLNEQCQVFLQDRNAYFADRTLDKVCYSIKCRSSSRDGYYLAGPALEGTPCTNGKCKSGECKSFARSGIVTDGGWSDWSVAPCKSACIKGSRGTVLMTRACDNPRPVNSISGCDGSATKIELCDDSDICRARKPVTIYATEKCKEFAKFSKIIRRNAPGSQQSHLQSRPWQACSIFCKREDNGMWYTPRLELNDKGVSAAFPDGTWCHNDGNEDYFCMERQCLPQSKSLARSFEPLLKPLDTFNNAVDEDGKQILQPSHKTKDYFSVDENGIPLIDELEESQPGSEHFKGDDYIILDNLNEI